MNTLICSADSRARSACVPRAASSVARANSRPLVARTLALSSLIAATQQRCDEIERQRKDDRRAFLVRDVGERLQVAQLHRRGLLRQQLCRLYEHLRSLLLALSVNDLGTASALGFCLPCHRA